MDDSDAETVDFGARHTAAAGAPGETSGHAVHRGGYLQAPARIPGADTDADGHVLPSLERPGEG